MKGEAASWGRRYCTHRACPMGAVAPGSPGGADRPQGALSQGRLALGEAGIGAEKHNPFKRTCLLGPSPSHDGK